MSLCIRPEPPNVFCVLRAALVPVLTRRDGTRWVAKEARPISLRQLMVFGRSLTESRLISSANYVRTELPTRLVILLLPRYWIFG